MIEVLQFFRGRRTNEHVIAPGEYEDNDGRLFGCADYLLQHGFAVRLSDPEPEPDSITQVEGVQTLTPKRERRGK